MTRDPKDRETRRVNTVDTGLMLLSMVREFGPMTSAVLTERAGMSRGQIHSYLNSFHDCGLLEKDAKTGAYGVGSLALDLGAARLLRLEAQDLAIEETRIAAEDCGHTISIAVWGSYGPTVTAVLAGSREVRSSASPGTIYSVTGTATGRLFAALLPDRMVRRVAEDQAREAHPVRYVGECPPWEDAAEAIAETRERDLSLTYSWPQPGVSAIAAPVRNFSGHLAMAVTLIGDAKRIDIGLSGPEVTAIRALAAQISHGLGYFAP